MEHRRFFEETMLCRIGEAAGFDASEASRKRAVREAVNRLQTEQLEHRWEMDARDYKNIADSQCQAVPLEHVMRSVGHVLPRNEDLTAEMLKEIANNWVEIARTVWVALNVKPGSEDGPAAHIAKERTEELKAAFAAQLLNAGYDNSMIIAMARRFIASIQRDANPSQLLYVPPEKILAKTMQTTPMLFFKCQLERVPGSEAQRGNAQRDEDSTTPTKPQNRRKSQQKLHRQIHQDPQFYKDLAKVKDQSLTDKEREDLLKKLRAIANGEKCAFGNKCSRTKTCPYNH